MASEDTVSFLASLQAENATLLARCEQAEAQLKRWVQRAINYYPVDWEMDASNPELMISNIVESAIQEANARADKVEATVAACKAAGFVDEKGNVVRFEKQYWRADTEGDSCEDLEELADSCGDGEFLEVTPLLILPRELYVVQVNADGTGSHREATTEERQRWEQAEREWRERAKVLPTRTAAEAARGGEQNA
jgi:hypothetical protein